MKNEVFLEALSRVCNDPEFESKLKCNKRKRAKAIAKGVLCSLALIVLVGTVILFGIISGHHSNPNSSGNNEIVLLNTGSDNSTPLEEQVLTAKPDSEQTPDPENNFGDFGNIQIGRDLLIGQENAKPETGHMIGLRLYNFCTDNVVSIEAYMHQFIAKEINPLDYDGYPVFAIREVDPYNYNSETHARETINNTKLIVNGEKGNYEKRFTVEDLSFLGVSDMNRIDVIEYGHREALTLNFENYNVGDFVHVVFSYGFFYYKNNPYNESKRDNSFAGKSRSLTLYIGEYGIYITESQDHDVVITEYNNITEGLKEIGHKPPDGAHC